MSTPDKAQVEKLVDLFAATTRTHVLDRTMVVEPEKSRRELLDEAIDEVIAALAAFSAMSVSKVPSGKVQRLDDFNATFRAQLAQEIVSSFQPFHL